MIYSKPQILVINFRILAGLLASIFIHILLTLSILVSICITPISAICHYYRRQKLVKWIDNWTFTLADADKLMVETYLCGEIEFENLFQTTGNDVLIVVCQLNIYYITTKYWPDYIKLPHCFNIKRHIPEYFSHPLFHILHFLPSEKVFYGDLDKMVSNLHNQKKEKEARQLQIKESLVNDLKRINNQFAIHRPDIKNFILQTEKICVICAENVDINDIVSDCGHMFHEKCLRAVDLTSCKKCDKRFSYLVDLHIDAD